MPKCKIHVYAENDFKNYEDEIDSERLTKLANGKINLIRFLELFEIYEQLLDAHIEAKSVFYKLNIKSRLKAEDTAQYFHTTRNELNRRLFNTLNLGKLYLDKHFFKNKSFVFKVTQSAEKHQKVQEHRQG
ncbi:MAG: hypothetical protein LAT53_07220 [Idiomarina sp.]|nr:hypothetical protein [Idiomarina sp.]